MSQTNSNTRQKFPNRILFLIFHFHFLNNCAWSFIICHGTLDLIWPPVRCVIYAVRLSQTLLSATFSLSAPRLFPSFILFPTYFVFPLPNGLVSFSCFLPFSYFSRLTIGFVWPLLNRGHFCKHSSHVSCLVLWYLLLYPCCFIESYYSGVKTVWDRLD